MFVIHVPLSDYRSLVYFAGPQGPKTGRYRRTAPRGCMTRSQYTPTNRPGASEGGFEQRRQGTKHASSGGARSRICAVALQPRRQAQPSQVRAHGRQRAQVGLYQLRHVVRSRLKRVLGNHLLPKKVVKPNVAGGQWQGWKVAHEQGGNTRGTKNPLKGCTLATGLATLPSRRCCVGRCAGSSTKMRRNVLRNEYIQQHSHRTLRAPMHTHLWVAWAS